MLGAAIAAFSAGIATSAVRAKLASLPVAIAASSWGLDVSKIEREASYEGILSFDEMYQRHTGVLDILITPWMSPYLASRMERDPAHVPFRAIAHQSLAQINRAAQSSKAAFPHLAPERIRTMPTIKTNDGAEIFYKDWRAKNGSGQPIVFHHGWPLSADDWDTQMLFFLKQGYRVIAHDHRGHGRSSQTAHGHDMDTYAADVAAVMAKLDLRDVIHVGHSTGGGKATRYVARHGRGHTAKLVLIGAVPPVMLKSASNPGGTPIEVFDGLRTALAANRSSFYWDFTFPFYSYNRKGAAVNEQVRHNWMRQAMMGGAHPQYECIKAFSETDFTEDCG